MEYGQFLRNYTTMSYIIFDYLGIKSKTLDMISDDFGLSKRLPNESNIQYRDRLETLLIDIKRKNCL